MSVAPAGVALTGNTPGPESKYRLAPNRNNQWPSRLQILIQEWPQADWMHTPEAIDVIRNVWRGVEPLKAWLNEHVAPPTNARN